MRLFFLQMLGLLLLGYPATSQSSRPEILLTSAISNQPVCSFLENKVGGDTSGIFAPDNKFRVELLNPDDRSILGNYPATFRYNGFFFKVAEDPAIEDLRKSGGYVSLRVVSTSPARSVELATKLRFYNRGSVVLQNANAVPDTVDRDQVVQLSLLTTANNAVVVVLSDSSSVFASAYSQIRASVSAQYSIVRATNECGVAVPGSGSAAVAVNPVRIRPTDFKSAFVCDGTAFELYYQSIEGTVPPTAAFKLRFVKRNSAEPGESGTFEVPVVRKQDGLLAGRIPYQKLQNPAQYKVAIVVDKPAVLSPYSDWFTIDPKPVASFRYQNDTARLGETYRLFFNISGPPPYSLELTNGATYFLGRSDVIELQPVRTEAFEIKSLRTLCGVETDLPKQKVILTVPPAIALKVSADKPLELCENQVVRIPILSNVAFNAGTRFFAEGITEDEKTYQFEATLVADSIEFRIPFSPEEWGKEGYFNIRRFRVKTTGPDLVSKYAGWFSIRGIPRVSYGFYESQDLDRTRYFDYSIFISGGFPVSAVDYLGNMFFSQSSVGHQKVLALKSGNYAPRSISNGCYSSDSLPEVNLRVHSYKEKTPFVTVYGPPERFVCEGDSVEIGIDAFGEFGEGNEFRILLPRVGHGTWKTVKGPGKYKFPASFFEEGYNDVQVISTNPEERWISYQSVIVVGTKPPVAIDDELVKSTPDNPLVFSAGARPYLNVEGRILPQSSTLVVAGKEYNVKQTAWTESRYYPPVEPGKLTPVTYKSITNGCGTTVYNRDVYFYWKPFEIKEDQPGHVAAYCAGSEIVYPFNIVQGTVPPGTEFQLEIARDARTYTKIATVNSVTPLRYRIPENYESGRYQLRITSAKFVISEGRTILIRKKPTASIMVSSRRMADPEVVSPVDDVEIRYDLSGEGPYRIKDTVLPGYSSVANTAFSYTKQLKKETEIKILEVSNFCGTGAGSGERTIRVKPMILNLSADLKNICAGESLPIRYQVAGDMPPGTKIGFSLTGSNGRKYVLTSVSATSGKVSPRVPADLPSGNYVLACYIDGTDALLSEIIRIRRNPAIELTGSTTINSGDFTYLYLKPDEDSDLETKIRFSNGQFEKLVLNSPFGRFVSVMPAATTTYTVDFAQSGCGPLETRGRATVIVNPPAPRSVKVSSISTPKGVSGNICSGDSLYVYFVSKGFFSQDNRFALQIFDTRGVMVPNINFVGKQSPIKLIVPDHLISGASYRLRVVASDTDAAAADFHSFSIF